MFSLGQKPEIVSLPLTIGPGLMIIDFDRPISRHLDNIEHESKFKRHLIRLILIGAAGATAIDRSTAAVILFTFLVLLVRIGELEELELIFAVEFLLAVSVSGDSPTTTWLTLHGTDPEERVFGLFKLHPFPAFLRPVFSCSVAVTQYELEVLLVCYFVFRRLKCANPIKFYYI